jgi:hypothetical protein
MLFRITQFLAGDTRIEMNDKKGRRFRRPFFMTILGCPGSDRKARE